MNKRILALIALVLVFALGLSACGCAHETWTEADCLNPKTCADCGETEGEALGHAWKDATCDAPKTCSRCAATEGAALGHAWNDATCAAPKTCERCELTEGDALPHANWLDATTDAPKTCADCGATEGEKINTDPRFTTANTLGLYGDWYCDVSLPGTISGLDDFETPFQIRMFMNMTNDGHATVTFKLNNVEELRTDLTTYMANLLYETMAALNYTKEDTDAYAQSTFGMSVDDYAASVVATMDLEHMFDGAALEGVYYTEDGVFYIADDWDETMDANNYTLDGDTFTLHDDPFGLGMGDAVFTRVTE